MKFYRAEKLIYAFKDDYPVKVKAAVDSDIVGINMNSSGIPDYPHSIEEHAEVLVKFINMTSVAGPFYKKLKRVEIPKYFGYICGL